MNYPPINQECEEINERFYTELISKSYDSVSYPDLYIKLIPNIRREIPKKISKRMANLRKAGIIGCLNNTNITSENYKKIIYETV